MWNWKLSINMHTVCSTHPLTFFVKIWKSIASNSIQTRHVLGLWPNIHKQSFARLHFYSTEFLYELKTYQNIGNIVQPSNCRWNKQHTKHEKCCTDNSHHIQASHDKRTVNNIIKLLVAKYCTFVAIMIRAITLTSCSWPHQLQAQWCHAVTMLARSSTRIPDGVLSFSLQHRSMPASTFCQLSFVRSLQAGVQPTLDSIAETFIPVQYAAQGEEENV